MERNEITNRAVSQHFDICIIGGGITGAGLLYEATQRGYSAILLEKNDLASGTSSRSSKFIHGGVRYLKYLQFELIKEAVNERSHLLKKYNTLINPVGFILPCYTIADFKIKQLLFKLYDFISGKSKIRTHEVLNADNMKKRFPFYKRGDVKGGIIYWEGITNDSVLAINIIAECVLYGQVVLNYAKVNRFEITQNQLSNITCYDSIGNREIKITAKVFINATGVWTDDILKLLQVDNINKMEPSKGVHIGIHRKFFPTEYACLFPSHTADKRYLYTIPWENDLTLIGATDTFYNKSPDEATPEKDDVAYILNAFNSSFKDPTISKKEIVCVYAGLRPLLSGNTYNTYKRSREYQIWWSNKNLINIAGGKYTSFLSMAKKCLNEVNKKYEINSLAAKHKIKNIDKANQMRDHISEMQKKRSEYATSISEEYKLSKMEIEFYIKYQFAEKVEDILTRRTSITYKMKLFDESLVKEVSELMAILLKKDNNWIKQQCSEYYEHWKYYHPNL